MSLESELKKTNTLLTQILERLPVAVSGQCGSAYTSSIAPLGCNNDIAETCDETLPISAKDGVVNGNTAANDETIEPTEEETADYAELRANLTKAITAKAAAHADKIRAILAKYDASRLPEVADHDLKAVTAEVAEL